MLWKVRTTTLDLSHHSKVMGILNVTPDSFSDGGAFDSTHLALAHAREMISQGASIIDIGGESSRPGASPVDPAEEIRRTTPVIQAIRAEWDGLISIDTTKSSVARSALSAGADIVNDISGLTADPAMPSLCAAAMCGVVVMHMRGTPGTMQQDPNYGDVVAELRSWFLQRHSALTAAGIPEQSLCYDPGIGFGKTLRHNLTLIRNLRELPPLRRPLLLGVSRKSFISKVISSDRIPHRDSATAVITALARRDGVMLHRVHNVAASLQAILLAESLH